MRRVIAIGVFCGLAGCTEGDTPAGETSTSDATGSSTSSSTTSEETSESSSSTSTGAAESSSSSGSTSEATGGSSSSTGVEAPYYEPCRGDDSCAPLICNDFTGFCTSPCRAPEDCPPAATGNATPTCSMTTTTCVLSCIDGEMCPDGMTCEGNTELAFCQF